MKGPHLLESLKIPEMPVVPPEEALKPANIFLLLPVFVPINILLLPVVNVSCVF